MIAMTETEEEIKVDFNLGVKEKVALIFLASVLGIAGITWTGVSTTKSIQRFFNEKEIVFQKVFVFSADVNSPIVVKNKEAEAVMVYMEPEETNELIENSKDPDLAKYICDKFGPVDCPIALAVANAESGMRADAYHFNSNNTLDFGVMQINSIHWGKEGCSMKELVDPYKNVDCGYNIKQESGWTAWTVVNTGAYLAYLAR
jgi:hypothetical protein